MREVLGNLQGIKKNILATLEELYDVQIPQDQLLTEELAETMRNISAVLNREIAILIARNGKVESVTIGSSADIHPETLELRRGQGRLSGIRCIHTHPFVDSILSKADLSALKNMRLDALAAIGWRDESAPSMVSFGLITDSLEDGQLVTEEFGPYGVKEAASLNFTNLLNTLEKLLAQKVSGHSLASVEEKAVLVSLDWQQTELKWTAEDSLEELALLAKTAGAKVVGKFLQKKAKPDPATFIGAGKVKELATFIQNNDVDLCVFDEELSPAQNRNLENALGIRVLDRTALILDIFAGRANSNEGKLQVELAQLKYALPRVMGQGAALSRLGGGIGTRGPGETKLEVDRRKIRERISFLEDQIEKLRSVRILHRTKRKKNNIPQVCLVGYTNAGKSTLLNTLTNADAYVMDQLFATLDTTTRGLTLPDKQEIILTDTVGFIQRLPHQLVAAFKSTLEEVTEADLLLHVVDISHELYQEQEAAVYDVLAELGVADKPIVTVYNKIDKLENDNARVRNLSSRENVVFISCEKKLGLDKLLELIGTNLNLSNRMVTLCIPYAATGLAAKLYEVGTVENQTYDEKGIVIKVSLHKDLIKNYEQYIIDEGGK